MEQLTEEEMAVIWAKLEELDKKLDENLQKWDDMNQKLGEVNAVLRSGSTSSGMPASASSSTSSTSSPPRDAALVVSLPTTELPPMTPTNCSTAGLNQSAGVPGMATMALVPFSTSSTSVLPQDASTALLMATSEHSPVASTRCSTLGLYQAAHVPEPATMESTPLSASSTSTSPQDALPADPIFIPFITKSKPPSQVSFSKCSTVSSSTRCSSGNYDAAAPSLMAIPLLNFTKASPAAMIGALKWLPSTSVENGHKVFEVTPMLLFLPPATWYTSWSFQSAAELRPMAWPPFSCSSVNEPPKHQSPPMHVLMEDSVIEMRPTPWPSFSNSCY